MLGSYNRRLTNPLNVRTQSQPPQTNSYNLYSFSHITKKMQYAFIALAIALFGQAVANPIVGSEAEATVPASFPISDLTFGGIHTGTTLSQGGIHTVE